MFIKFNDDQETRLNPEFIIEYWVKDQDVENPEYREIGILYRDIPDNSLNSRILQYKKRSSENVPQKLLNDLQKMDLRFHVEDI